MKKRRVMRLLALGLAAVLAASSIQVSGMNAYASELTDEQTQDDTNEVTPEPTEVPEVTDTPEPTEEPEATDTPEPTEEPEVTDTPEPTEVPDGGIATYALTRAVAASEDVELTQFCGAELTFDSASSWDAKAETQLGLSSNAALNSGAVVSFDVYIPADAADYSGELKFQGVARLGSNWDWTECSIIPGFASSALTETVEVDGTEYKKANISYTFGDEITADYLAEFTVVVAGWQCDYTGSVYYANAALQNGEAADNNNQEDVTLTQFYGQELAFDNTSDWDDQGEAQLGLSTAQALNSGAKVSFDVYVPADAAAFNGVIKLQGIARLGSNWTWTENTTIAEFNASGLTTTVEIDDVEYKKTSVSYTFGEEIEADYLAEFTVKLAGWQCDYSGSIYYANAKVTDAGTGADEDEEITLSMFGTEDVDLDETKEWSEHGIFEIGLSTNAALKNGAAISFDIYVPADAATFDGQLKFQGVARLGSNWSWTECPAMSEYTATDFANAQAVTIDEVEYKKVTAVYTFGNAITADYLANFSVKIAGYQCTYVGPIYYANAAIVDGTGESSGPEVSGESAEWTFDEDIAGWTYDGVWENDGENSIAWDETMQALALTVDYSQNVATGWSEVKTSYWGDDFALAGANTMKFDLIYNPSGMTTGGFAIKLFASGGVDVNSSIDFSQAQDCGNGLKKVAFTITFDNTDIANGFTIGLVGKNTDYNGVIYLDNVVLSSEEREPEADIYVDATVEVTGQGVALTVSGTTLTTGAGNATISQSITLVDPDAMDCVKQVYAYLKAVGSTNSVIFGQQNNTSHKAGASNLSVSDTMDVVGSYAGVIGIDGLALVGDEYSAGRYISDMEGVDAAYDAVVAQMNAASTNAEKNVIAAAALTNFNIRNGAIATLSLHMPNFSTVGTVSAGNGAPTYAGYNFSGYTVGTMTGDVMNNLLPGGAYNAQFTAYLDMVADYAKRVDGAILFRPFHENTGSWFWWGAAFCDAATYKNVFKYTVEYLRDTKDVHNLLYVYGPGAESTTVAAYGERYPGDGYVDMVGFDMYHDNPTTSDNFIARFTQILNVVDTFATQHGKLVAVTETGIRNNTAPGDNQTALLKQENARPDWYTEIMNAVKASNASYYLVWANFSETDGFYTPYVKSVTDGVNHGHEMMDHFISFFNQSGSIFAVNQKQALSQMANVEISVNAALAQDGYLVSPVSGSRVLAETAVTARVSGVTEADAVEFVFSGDVVKTVAAQVADGNATATLSAEDLEALGTVIGELSIQINGTVKDTISLIYNIPEPVADPYEIDGFEDYYGIQNLLLGAWSTNHAEGSSITLNVVENVGIEGDYALQFTYNETSDGWAGATISKEVSWADCDALTFWTVPDGKCQKTVIQITANGNVYEYYLNLNADYAAVSGTAVQVTIPFAEFVARDIAGNPAGGLVQDKADITAFGLWVNAIPGSAAISGNGTVSGTIYYDAITAVNSGLSEATVEAAGGNVPQISSPGAGAPGDAEPAPETNNAVNSGVAVVEPSYTNEEGVVVSGWPVVVKEAYEDAVDADNQEDGEAADAGAGTATGAQEETQVHVDATNVTELVIPENAVQTMIAQDAVYNIYMGGVAVTMSSEALAGANGSIDIKVDVTYQEDFGQGFDAMFITSRTQFELSAEGYLNVVLGAENTGKPAYVFVLTADGTYRPHMAQFVSEIGTVTIPFTTYDSYVILY